ncbi:hypothetical protein BB558_002337 [Smittium angustum]|uniref:SPX domain-containing protein n=1 Tax=Smittium angustum TaxID=133377 RepID=A0A2U1J932_SMIAN|nr:hypothetical protein BB558_002337 [Smittium angustum]
MKFGKYMNNNKIEGWEDQYLDYKALKKLIGNLLKKNQLQNDQSIRSEAKSTFFHQLDMELEKVGFFYSNIELWIKNRNSFLNSKQAELKNSIQSMEKGYSHKIILLSEAWNHLQSELDKLQNFAEINSTGVSKIVKKWDKQTRSATKQLYIERQSVIRPWFDKASITNLADKIAEGILELHRLEDAIDTHHYSSTQLFLFEDIKLNSPVIINHSENTNFSEQPPQEKQIDQDIDIEYVTKEIASGHLSPPKVKDIVDAIISGKVDVFWSEEISNRTLIHECAKTGNLEIISASIRKGAKINAVDAYNRYPLYYSITGGHSNVTKELILHGANKMVDSRGTPSLLLAATAGDFSTFNFILTKSMIVWTEAELGDALFKCASRGNLDMIIALHKSGLDTVSITNVVCSITLHVAAQNGHLELVKWLVDNGASVNAIDKDLAWTPLFYAASEGRSEVVKFLLENNCDPNLNDEQGHSAAFYAAYRGFLDCVSLFPTNTEHKIVANKEDIFDYDTIPSLELPPPVIPLQVSKRPDNSRKTRIVIQVSSDSSKLSQPVEFRNHTHLNSLRLQVSIRPEPGILPQTVKLPLQTSSERMSFEVPTDSPFFTEILLFPSFGSKIIGKAYLSNDFFGCESATAVKIPLIGSDHEVVAELLLDFLIIQPPALKNEALLWNNLQFDSNTKPKDQCLTVDVQVTTDGIPIVYSPENISLVPGVDISPYFLKFSDLKALRSCHLPSLKEKDGLFTFGDEAQSITWRNELSISCVPLSELLLALPKETGVVISIIPPPKQISSFTLNEFVDKILSVVSTSLVGVQNNEQNDEEKVYENLFDRCTNYSSNIEKQRSIFFSSSSPAICLLAQWKQPTFPVILDAKNCYPTQNPSWTSLFPSLKLASKFAFAENLFGLVCDYELLTKVPDIASAIKLYHLFLIQKFPHNLHQITKSSTCSITNGCWADGLFRINSIEQ